MVADRRLISKSLQSDTSYYATVPNLLGVWQLWWLRSYSADSLPVPCITHRIIALATVPRTLYLYNKRPVGNRQRPREWRCYINKRVLDKDMQLHCILSSFLGPIRDTRCKFLVLPE